MQKMIAFQKMMFQTYLFYPTRVPKGQRKPNGEDTLITIMVIILFFFSVLACSLTFSSEVFSAGFFVYPAALMMFRIIKDESFLYRLPLKRKFIVAGIFVFNVSFIFLVMLFFLCLALLTFILGTLLSAGWFAQDAYYAIQGFILSSIFYIIIVDTLIVIFFFKKVYAKVLGLLVVSIAIISASLYLRQALPENFSGYPRIAVLLKSAPNSWLVMGAVISAAILLTLLEIQLTIGIDRYNRRIKPAVCNKGSES